MSKIFTSPAKVKTGAKIKAFLSYFFTRPETVRRLLAMLYKGYFVQTGWLQSSAQQKPLDVNGQPLPWLNYPVIEFLEERLKPDMQLFEYGGGYSTQYFAGRVAHVTTVEHNRQWFDHLQQNAADNNTVIFCELEYNGKYAASARDSGKKFDVILVDGRDRVCCAENALPALTPGGVLIFDDFEREKYQSAVAILAGQGFRELGFWGFKPGFFDRSKTSIFYRDNNVFGL